MKKFKKMYIAFAIIIMVLLFMLTLGGKTLLNITNNIKKEKMELLSYQIYDNTDNSNIQTLIKINTENGIEYIVKPDGTKIYANGKTMISLDYSFQINNEETFIIKEIDKDEINKKIVITETGSKSYPFIITTAEQLQNIQNYKKEMLYNIDETEICYKLGNNIDLNDIEWEPIGTEKKTFKGTLYGNGYTISNLTINNNKNYQGLFGYVTGNLEGIIVENFNISGESFIGAISGYTEGNIKNCKVINSKISGNADHVGGIVGRLIEKNLSYNIIENCKISGNSYIGGITGRASGTCENNTVKADIEGKSNYIGGIVGASSGVANSNIVDVNIESNSSYIGGIVGHTKSAVNTNTANVNIAGNDYIGGIAGYVAGWFTGKSAIIENNKSFGEIEGNTNIGGLIGELHMGNVSEAQANYNYSKCNIIGNGDNIGGLIGKIYASAQGGDETAEIYLDQNYATGNVISNGNNVGGLVGYVFSKGIPSSRNGKGIVHIKNSFSYGEVSANDYAGAFIGLAQREGYSSGGDILIKYSYSTSKVNCNNSNIEYFNYIDNATAGTFTCVYNYNINNLTGIDNTLYADNMKEEDMYIQSNFIDWDFKDIWTTDENTSMPYLKNLDKPID